MSGVRQLWGLVRENMAVCTMGYKLEVSGVLALCNPSFYGLLCMKNKQQIAFYVARSFFVS